MAKPWLHIIGIGEDGLESLLPLARTALQTADIIIGDSRHLNAVKDITPKAKQIPWPTPFDALTDTVLSHQNDRVALLATGDPLWYSIGAIYARLITPEDIIFYPQISAFQWAAARMGWGLAGVETLSLHGRPLQTIIPFIQPNQRLLILTDANSNPHAVAELLTTQNYGNSKLSVLSHLGSPREKQFHGLAKEWSETVPAFHTLAVHCIADKTAIPTPKTGLPDGCFTHDGTMTKQDIRAITLAKLIPTPRARLWDVGCGCGSVAIEWMRGAKGATAIGIEPREDRRALTAQNALALGAPSLDIRAGHAPAALMDLPTPDAVFIGGGVSVETAEFCLKALPLSGRLVCNAVTLESEQILADLYMRFGGHLTRLQCARAEPIGSKIGWRPAMPVTQWSIIKS